MSQSPGVVGYGTTVAPRPDRATGIFKLVVGLGLAAAGGYLFFYNVDRQVNQSGGDTGTGVFVGFILGFGAWALVNGAIQTAGRPTSWAVGIGAMVLTIVACALVFPRAAQTARRNMEQQYWDRLQASKKTSADYTNYLYTSLPRKGVFAEAGLVRVNEEMARTGKEAQGRVGRLRSMVYDFKLQMSKQNEPALKDSIAKAQEALAETYAKAREELAERLEKSPAKSEFPEDAQMRAAFSQVLDRVARSENNFVYLTFASENKLPATVPPLPGTTDLVQADDAFNPARDRDRQRSFSSALEESLRVAFTEPLIKVQPLSPGDDRSGKVVFQVKCVTKRIPDEMSLTRSGQPAGSLFKIEVDWEFTAFDVDGKQLVQHRTKSQPAESFKFRFKKDEPTSAAYGYMMDSTYYNYCREVTGRLGLIPPPVKDDFR